MEYGRDAAGGGDCLTYPREARSMSYKYSVILCTLTSDGANVWETPGPILEEIASRGYDGVDVDAEPDRYRRRNSMK